MTQRTKALIVDDEPNVGENLTNILKDFCPEIDLLKISTTLPEAKADILRLGPKLVFLDIQIGTRMIFEMLESIEINFQIIFISAHNYALDAFKYGAVDYLLKPVDIKSLKIAVNKAIFKIKNELFSNDFENLLKINRQRYLDAEKIAVPKANGYQMVKISEILYCQAEGSYTSIFLKDKSHLIASKNLGFYEELLIGHRFFRIHNSSLVNSAHIIEVSKSDGGYIVMANGKLLSISKSRREETFNKLNLR